MTIPDPPFKPTLFELFGKLHAIERELWEHHGIRADGAYAEELAAAALGAKRNTNGVLRGSDIFHPELKRIEVRSRRKSLDQRDETRITITDKRGHFEYCVHLLFNFDYSVRGAYIVPHDVIFRFVDSGNSKIRFNEGARLPGSRDITPEVIAAQRRL